MTDPSFDRDVLRLLEAERPIPEPSLDAKARMFAAVMAKVGTAPSGESDGGAGVGGGGGTARGGLSLSGARAVAAIALSFAAGATTAALLVPAKVIVRTVAVPATPAPAPPPAPSAEPLPVLELTATPSSKPPSSTTAEPDARSLAAERALLDVARVAVASGEPDRALEAVARHAQKYPSGQLVEEREALYVRALILAGRYEEARERGARFLKRFKNGLMRPAVEGALESIPK